MQRNIYQRINAVRVQVAGYLQKEKQIGTGSYAYKVVTHDQVTAACRQALIDNGVVVSPSVTKSVVAPTGTTTGKGVPHIRYEATYSIDFINMDDPADRHQLIIEAHAIDEGDKAPGKAISYATKYALLKLFNFETGEDEEGRQADASGIDLLEQALTAMRDAKTVGEFRAAYKAAFESFQGNRDAIRKIQEVHDHKMAEAKRKQQPTESKAEAAAEVTVSVRDVKKLCDDGKFAEARDLIRNMMSEQEKAVLATYIKNQEAQANG